MYLVFDTETTGLPKNYQAPLDDFSNWPRLVQLAWNLYDAEGNKWESYSYIIKPDGFVIPPESTKIHRISQEKAEAEGVNLKFVLKKFSEDVSQATYLVGHNISFDESIIGSEFLRAKLPNPILLAAKICTMKESASVCKIDNGRGSYKWPNLTELYQFLFQKDFADAHDALIDVEACAECLFELKRRNLISR